MLGTPVSERNGGKKITVKRVQGYNPFLFWGKNNMLTLPGMSFLLLSEIFKPTNDNNALGEFSPSAENEIR